MKIAYCTPSLYMAGGVERVLTTKMNWLVEHTDHEVYVILTDGAGQPPFYPLDPRVHVIQLDINFEQLWHLSFLKKGLVFMRKQRQYKKALKKALLEIRPDITDSLMRREINFITSIKDGSLKIGELHVNRNNYRNFEANETNFVKRLFEKYWMGQLLRKVKKLDRFVVLSNEDAANWHELDNVHVIPNPLPQLYTQHATLQNKTVVACGRYVYQKGFDLLIETWRYVHERHADWKLEVYGKGERDVYQQQVEDLQFGDCIKLNGPTSDIESKYATSSIFVLSSRFEGFGMVLIEAMNCGVPCVSFACPCGPKDIITNGKDGILVPNGDVKALADGVCRLIEDEALRKQMGSAALARSLCYKTENVMQQWVGLFDELDSKLGDK